MTTAYLSIGSNIGERQKFIEQAVSFLGLCEEIEVVQTSALYETEPWGVKDQNWFLNVAVEINTTLSPQDLLVKCNQIESTLGRNRDVEKRWGERTVDIDIIFYGTQIINTDILVVPHTRMHERAFVLVPMLEITPEFVHPIFNKSMVDLYESLVDVEDVFLYGTRSVIQ